MDWLQEHMRHHITNAAVIESGENIMNFAGDNAAAARHEASEALDLVCRAAETIRGLQDRLAESESRARDSAASAIEKLQLAYARVHSAEAERGLAQENLSKLNERLEEAERELARAQSRIATAGAQLTNAERLLRASDTRAINAEKAVRQIEDAIRTQLIGSQRNPSRRSAHAA
jgi:chromosome segregation ATPase